MSAKGRGGPVVDHEFYGTPPKSVYQLLRDVPLPGGRWLEPSAGDGAIIRAVNSRRSDVDWTAVEIQARLRRTLEATGARTVIGNYLRTDVPGDFAVAIGNPPFSLAAHFVTRSLRLAHEVVLLLRLNWLGSSKSRRHVFEACGVPDIFVLAERPTFWGTGTDACDYGWMRWRRKGQKGLTKILWAKP